MSKMFDFISGKSRGKVAELESSLEHTAGYLGVEMEENQKLRAALTKIAFYDGFMDKEAATTMLVTAREALKQS